MLKKIAYQGADGKTHDAAYLTHGSAYQLTGNREQFAQLMAIGKSDIDAYSIAFVVEITPDTLPDIKEACRRLTRDTTILLRVQELKRPAIRKLERKVLFTQDKALEQCTVAWDLAYATQDVKGMLAATKLQAELCKLLVQQIDVKHTHEELDNASTEALLDMLKTVQVRQSKQKLLLEKAIKVEPTESQTPQRPPFVDAELVPSGGSTQEAL